MPSSIDIVKAAESGDVELLTRCLDTGLDPRDRHRYTVSFYLQNIASEKHREQMDGFLTESSAWTAAAACGQLECMRVLVSRGRHVPDRAVVHTAACGHAACLSFLLGSGGNARAVDRDDTDTDDTDSSFRDGEEIVTAFRVACASGRADCVRLLMAHGAPWDDGYAKRLAEERPEPQLECYRGDGGHDLVLVYLQQALHAWRQGGIDQVRIAMGGMRVPGQPGERPVTVRDPCGGDGKEGPTCGSLFSMCMPRRVKIHH